MTGALSLVSRDIRPAKAYPNAGNGRYRDAVSFRNVFPSLFPAKTIDRHRLARRNRCLPSALDIDGWYDWFKMIGVDTLLVSAKVVKLETFRYLATLADVNVAMCDHGNAVNLRGHSISIGRKTSVPVPAAGGFINDVFGAVHSFMYSGTTFAASAVKAIARGLAKLGPLYIANIEGRIRQFLMTGKTNTGTILLHLDCLLHRLIEVPCLGVLEHCRGFLRAFIIPNFRAVMGNSSVC